VGTSADPDEPRVRLLGPVEVVGGGGAVTLAPRERALLARLAIDAGRTVTVDRLVDDMWGDTPPASARNALQVYVSHLRARLGARAIASMGGGYRIELAAERVDSLVLERLVAVAMGLRSSGRAVDAIASLDEALALWSGDAMADLQEYAFARVESARLTELRATALEHLAEALLDAGQLDRLTDELAHRVRELPFRERLRAAVMTGLYRQGRAVDALALYAEVVDQLREELGLEPGPTLKALQRAILTDAPSLSSSTGVLPTGELTLLATALDSPASLESQLGDAYSDAVLAHRDLLRSTFSAHHGLTVPTDGERLLAAFPSAAEAVRAAIAAHRSLDDHHVAGVPADHVRIGVHTGTPRVVDQHYIGADVHRVVQVAQAAAGGQVVLTGPTVQHLDPALLGADGLAITDLGIHRLPEVVVPEHLHQVAPPGTSFPPPRSLGGRTMLPRTTVPLVGRRAELATLVDEATRSGRGVTTLVGPGGTGKTRLAVEVAEHIGGSFPGGVYFVALEAATTLDEAWAAIGAALDLPADARDEQGVAAHLGEQRTFVVLDNLEQLPEAAVAVDRLLATAETRILATSRRPTGVAGERLHTLEPLEDSGVSADASVLFASFAELARPGFEIDADNREAVARICRRLDGLPLAIELAAARSRQLSPQALASQLESSLDLVSGGIGRPDRQRSLRALAGWSLDLLTTAQQEMLEVVALFVGGVDLEMVARFPCSDGDPTATVLDLVEASLVRVSHDAAPRVTMLETIRQFALERLDVSDRADEARDLHLGAFVELARQLHPRHGNMIRASAVVRRERANIEAALAWALRRPGGVESAADIIIGLAEAWHEVGDHTFDYLARTSAGMPPGSPRRGWLTYWEFRRIWDTQTECLTVYDAMMKAEQRLRAAGDPAPLAALLAYGTLLGPDVGLSADWGVVRAQEAASLATEIGEDWLTSRVQGSLARALIDAGRHREAAGPLAAARAAAARIGDLHRFDMLALTEAQLASLRGDHARAWGLAVDSAPGLLAVRLNGSLAQVFHQLARLTAAERPTASALLTGMAMASWRRMDSIPNAEDLAYVRASVQSAISSLGEETFARLQAESESWSADDAVAWALDLLTADAH
jgi:predicted ATPase/DNA-binding SARP family transcriptional activator